MTANPFAVVSPASFNLDPGAANVVTVKFTPTPASVGPQTGSLSIAATGQLPISVTLTGTGVALPLLTVIRTTVHHDVRASPPT